MRYASRQELADLIGVDDRTLGRWQKDPSFPPHEKAKKRGLPNSYNVRDVIIWAAEKQKPGFELPIIGKEQEEPGETVTLQEAKRRREAARAEMEEIDLKTKRGEYLPAAEVEKAWRDHIMAARSKLLAIPSKAAAQLVGVEDRAEIQRWVEEQIYEALSELAGREEAEV